MRYITMTHLLELLAVKNDQEQAQTVKRTYLQAMITHQEPAELSCEVLFTGDDGNDYLIVRSERHQVYLFGFDQPHGEDPHWFSTIVVFGHYSSYAQALMAMSLQADIDRN